MKHCPLISGLASSPKPKGKALSLLTVVISHVGCSDTHCHTLWAAPAGQTAAALSSDAQCLCLEVWVQRGVWRVGGEQSVLMNWGSSWLVGPGREVESGRAPQYC